MTTHPDTLQPLTSADEARFRAATAKLVAAIDPATQAEFRRAVATLATFVKMTRPV